MQPAYPVAMPILPEKMPASEEEIDAFLRAFEGCTLPKEEFTHIGHLVTGACFVHQLGEAEAIKQMRLCLPRFNESVGGKNTETAGYHETISVFWIKVLAKLLEVNLPISRAEFAALAVERYRDRRDLFREFYDFDVVGSTEARRGWVAPTLRPVGAANV